MMNTNVTRSRFYFSFALVTALIIAIGFFRSFYGRPLFDLPPLPSILVIHGAVFTIWVVLFVIQTRLVATGRVAVHRKLGIAGAVVALLAIVTGFASALYSASITLPHPFGMTSIQFSAIALTSISLFAVFVIAAIALRRKSDYHKRLMVLAMLAVIGPPVGRLLLLLNAGRYFLIVQMAVPAVLLIWCVVNDWRKQRRIHPLYVIGGAVIVLSFPARIAMAQTDAWINFATWLVQRFS